MPRPTGIPPYWISYIAPTHSCCNHLKPLKMLPYSTHRSLPMQQKRVPNCYFIVNKKTYCTLSHLQEWGQNSLMVNLCNHQRRIGPRGFMQAKVNKQSRVLHPTCHRV